MRKCLCMFGAVLQAGDKLIPRYAKCHNLEKQKRKPEQSLYNQQLMN